MPIPSLSAPPTQAPVVEGLGPRPGGSVDDQVRGLMTKGWQDWIQAFLARLNATQRLIKTTTFQGSSASIGTTPLPLPQLGAGTYRVSIELWVTTPATVNSSLTVTIGATENAQNTTQTTAALTSNDVTKPLSATIIVTIDDNSPITYATTYASAGATAMVCRGKITVEQVA